jgi:hypothetical protein
VVESRYPLDGACCGFNLLAVLVQGVGEVLVEVVHDLYNIGAGHLAKRQRQVVEPGEWSTELHITILHY